MNPGRRFELIRELGSGAFGTVYLANMVSGGDFRKRVALKLLNAQWDASGDAGRRLRDEARLLGMLRHRSIVAVDDLVLLDGRWAVVMEHVPGADLERVLEAGWRLKRHVPAPAALELISAVASALDAAWSGAPEGSAPMRVVHRDIKPSNIRLTPDGDVKVLDFGIARGNFEGREARTEQVRYGSLGYMAPERVLGEDEGPEGDVYALGCVAVELLRGTALGRSALLPDQHSVQVQGAIAEISANLGDAGAPITVLLAEMLAYEPTDRPVAALVAERARKLSRAMEGLDLAEFSREMVPMVASILGDQGKEAQGALSEQILSGLDARDATTLDTLVEGSAFNRTSSALMTGSAPVEPPPQRGSRSLWIAAGLALALVLGLGVFAGLEMREDRPGLPAQPPDASVAQAAPQPAPNPPEAQISVAPSTTPTAPSVATSPASTTPTQADRTAGSGTTRGARGARAEQSGRVLTPPEENVQAVVGSPPGPTLRAVKFTAPAATSVAARCGSVKAAGTTSALLRDVPAGSCDVTATIDGSSLSTRVSVSAPTGFTCAASGGSLACQ